MTAKQHYETLLGDVYAWSVSVSGDPYAHAEAWLGARGLLDAAARGGRYTDLGAGFGAHAVPLARRGATVTAVDFDARLVGELRRATASFGARVTVHERDVLEHLALEEAEERPRAHVVLCLGDTLTHLADARTAETLVTRAAARLEPGGRLALAYRDSTGFRADGVARFVEVARDERRTMHCLLEPLDDERLRVTDLVTEVTADGPRTRMSDYVKLRLARDRVVGWAEHAGLSLVHHDDERRMTTLVFRRAP